MTSAQPHAHDHPAPDSEPLLRRPTVDDAASLWALAVGSVDENSPYAYLLMAEYFADTCVVAEDGGELVGFVIGFRPPADRDTQFVWQIVVAPSMRGTGLGGRMLDVCIEGGSQPVRWLEATVTPDNDASAQLFRGFARRHGVVCEETLAFAAEQFPAGSVHEPEMRFRLGPLPQA